MRLSLRQTTAWIIAIAGVNSALAQNTAFNFQGRLKKAGNLQTTAADLKFRLYDADSGGNQVGTELVFESGSAVPVTNGLFSVSLDFGPSVFIAFNGTALWLETDTRVPSGDPGGYVTTTPRQPLTSVPYANWSAAPWVTSGSNVSYILGSVGIGTAGPLTTLHVADNGTGSNVAAIIETTGLPGTTAATLGFYRSGAAKKQIQLSGVDDLEIFQGNGSNDSAANRMFMRMSQPAGDIFVGGAVGIGTTTPQPPPNGGSG